jgi:hypothetical protein
LRFVDLAMRVHPAEGIVAERAQRDDLFSRFQRQWIVHFDGRHLGVARQILRSPVMNLLLELPVPSAPCHVALPPCC